VAGCGPSLPVPTLDSVEPAEWYSGLDVELTIRGEDLFPSVQVVGGEVDIDRDYRLWLETPESSIELEGVTLHSHTKLGGWVRAGIEPGYYDLRVQAPSGTEAVLADAFRATETAVKSIEMSYDGAYSRRVGEIVQFELELTGWNDERVLEPLEVNIIAERPDGSAADVDFLVTLSEQSSLSELDGITGMLDEQGHATVSFRTTTPGALSLEVAPAQNDSPVQDDYLGLYFEAGAVDNLDVLVTPAQDAYTAGEILTVDLTLLDSMGNPTDVDDALLIQVKELCGGDTLNNARFVNLGSTEQISFEIQSATSEECPANMIIAEPILADSEGGASAPFKVASGEPDKVEVQNTFNTLVVAGGATQPTLTLSVQDAFGNTILDFDYNSLQFTDLDGDPLTANCFADSEAAICSLALYRAGDTIIAITDTARTFSGTSELITVQPAGPDDVFLTTDISPSNADDGRDFILKVVDEYENEIDLDESDSSSAPYFSVGSTEVSCSYLQQDLTGARYHCDLSDADVNRLLTVLVSGLNTTSNPFDVVNGALTSIDFNSLGDIKAGQSFILQLKGEDAHGNPFIDYSTGPAVVVLYDESGDIDTSVTLNSDGEAELTNLSLTTAWTDNRFHAEQFSIVLGDSDYFSVTEADMDHFLVEPQRSWGWVGADLGVSITAMDFYSNPITAYAGSVSLASSAGLGNTVTTDVFNDGTAEVKFAPEKPGFSDSLSASDGTFVGASALIDVFDSDCDNAPVAAITIDGNDTGLACINSGITSPILLSASESNDGGASLTKWYFYTEPKGWQSSTVDYINQEWTTEGAFEVSVLVADSNACADQASSVLYVAVDDGEPAGPVTLTPTSTLLQSDTTDAAGETSVEVYATTCTGADASGGTVLLRADIGTITGTGLTATGSGLALSLDSKGKGTVDWSVGDQPHGGTGTLYTGRSDGAAAGNTAATISGDSWLPTVIGVSPSGTVTQEGPLSTIEIAFSETILGSSITTGSIELTDESGEAVGIDTLTLSDGSITVDESLQDSVLEIGLENSVYLSDEILTITVTSDVTDVAGNALDGSHTGSAGAFILEIGDVTDDAPELSDCSMDVESFRPDGDNGSGTESDTAELSVTATDTSVWWQLEILSEDGELVFFEHVYSGSSMTVLTWDGRNSAGFIVGNGEYQLRVAALDESWNAGLSCSATVTVDNHLQ
jgi:hypothetical protein